MILRIRSWGHTAADMTTRCAFKIEDPSRGPGRIDFRAPGEGFGLEGIPKPKIQRDPSPLKRKTYMWYAAVPDQRGAAAPQTTRSPLGTPQLPGRQPPQPEAAAPRIGGSGGLEPPARERGVEGAASAQGSSIGPRFLVFVCFCCLFFSPFLCRILMLQICWARFLNL